MFAPLFSYIGKGLDQINDNKMYSEDIMSSLFTLLVNSVDTNKQNQEFIIKNFKIYDILKAILYQVKSLKVAGIGALLLSHLVWNYVDGQAVFSTREIVKRIIYLLDFN